MLLVLHLHVSSIQVSEISIATTEENSNRSIH